METFDYNYYLNYSELTPEETELITTLKEDQENGRFQDINYLKTVNILGLKEVSESTFENNMESLFLILDSKYGDNWGVFLEPIFCEDGSVRAPTFKFNIFILYPEILIRNRNERTHLIKNLIVNLPIVAWNKILHIEGCRITVSNRERRVEYAHSHLKRVNYNNITDIYKLTTFCVGNATAISEILVNISENLEFDALLFEALLYSIDALVEYESLEGGPYIKIEAITSNSTSYSWEDIDMNLCKFSFEEIFSYTTPEEFKNIMKHNFVFHNGSWKIKNKQILIEFLKEKIVNHRVNIQSLLYIEKVSVSDISELIIRDKFQIDIENLLSELEVISFPDEEIPAITLKCGKIPFSITASVENTEQEKIDNLKKSKLSNNLLKYAIKRIEDKLKEEHIKQYAL